MDQPASQPNTFHKDRHPRLKLKPNYHEIDWNAEGERARRTRMRRIMPDGAGSLPLYCLSPDNLIIDAATIMHDGIIGAVAIIQENALVIIST